MKNITKVKALRLLLLIGLIPLASFAQSDVFFKNENDDIYRDDSWSYNVNTQNFGETPLGSGLLILTRRRLRYLKTQTQPQEQHIQRYRVAACRPYAYWYYRLPQEGFRTYSKC